jgi:Gas vesicle protein
MTPQRNHSPAAPAGTQAMPSHRAERVALVDLLDRVLGGGVVIAGDVTLSIADVDLVTVSLRALVTSVSAMVGAEPDAEGRRR